MQLLPGQSPFDSTEENQVVFEPDPIHSNVRFVSRCGLIVCAVLTVSILARLLPAVRPLYSVAIAIGVVVLLATLLLGRNPENRLFALIVAALAGGGLLLGWWDFLWHVFSDISGASLIYQLLIVVGTVVLSGAIFKAIQAGRQQ